MSGENNAHIIFDGEKIFVSSNIVPIFQFLMEIDKEVESLLGFEKKLELIRKQYSEVLNACLFLAEKLQKNNIDFGEYKFSEKPETISEKLKLHLPIRSQMIVLFSNLEVLFALHIAYQEQTDDDDFIRKMTMDKKIVRKFLSGYCLTDDNEWYKKNKKGFSVSAWQFRKFRNSLTHFFSVSDGIAISPDAMKNEAMEVQKSLKKVGSKIAFLSPEDLYAMIKGAVVLMMKEWHNDSLLHGDNFARRMSAVQSVVEKNGAILMKLNSKKS